MDLSRLRDASNEFIRFHLGSGGTAFRAESGLAFYQGRVMFELRQTNYTFITLSNKDVQYAEDWIHRMERS